MTSTASHPKITALRGADITLADAADEFLSTHRVANPNTHRAYASAIDRTIAAVGGRDHLLAVVTDAEIGDALTSLWGELRQPPGTATVPPSPPGSPGAPPRSDGRRHLSAYGFQCRARYR